MVVLSIDLQPPHKHTCTSIQSHNIDDVCFLGFVRTPEEFNTMEHAIAQWCRCDRSSCAFVNSHDFRSLRRFVLYGRGTQHSATCNESNLCVTMLDSGMMLVCAPMYLYDSSLQPML
jgi:hypothetical protein